MSTKSTFLDIFNKEMKNFGKIMLDFPWENETAYAYWLAQTYYFVRHSTRLLAQTASKFSLEDEKAHVRFCAHLGEEKSHEKLATNDLKKLNWDLSEIPELPETSALYQTQFFWINQISPHALMGYIFTLEGAAEQNGKEIYKRVISAHGDKCASFIKVHATEDEDHLEKAFSYLDSMKPQELGWLIQNFQASSSFYQMMLKKIETIAKGIKMQKAG